MDDSEKLNATLSAASQIVGQELQAFTTHSNHSSHAVATYALENILLHQAAAQQLHVRFK